MTNKAPLHAPGHLKGALPRGKMADPIKAESRIKWVLFQRGQGYTDVEIAGALGISQASLSGFMASRNLRARRG